MIFPLEKQFASTRCCSIQRGSPNSSLRFDSQFTLTQEKLHGLQELHFHKQNHDPGEAGLVPVTVTILFIEVDFMQAISLGLD